MKLTSLHRVLQLHDLHMNNNFQIISPLRNNQNFQVLWLQVVESAHTILVTTALNSDSEKECAFNPIRCLLLYQNDLKFNIFRLRLQTSIPKGPHTPLIRSLKSVKHFLHSQIEFCDHCIVPRHYSPCSRAIPDTSPTDGFTIEKNDYSGQMFHLRQSYWKQI